MPVLAYLLRSLAIGVSLCAFIALFISIAFRDPFQQTLVYSLCIGLTCQLLIDGGRRSVALALRHIRPAAPCGAWPGWPWALGIIVFGIWGGIALGYPLAGWLLGSHRPVPGLDNWRTLFIVVTVSLLAALGMTAYSWTRARVAATEARAQRAQRAAAENQLKLLESQLEPHMLFNTLANLRVLIALDPPRAQAMLDRLIAFLRATLDASRVGSHSLAAEFDRLADYLALMQVRMGPRLQFGFELPAALRDAPVPPLLLQPLVENCIQHGLEPKIEGGRVDVIAAHEATNLVLVVRDSGVGLRSTSATQGTRFGTQQVRERLLALYGAEATFTLGPAPHGGTEARITMPLRP
jgi:hypothetical protein